MLYRGERDETLVMLTLAGETRAYEVLVVRYQNAVMAAANSVIHNGNLAEDAAQDAFITAWMKLDTLRERDKFGAWVCRIAKNCAKNMIVRFRSYLPIDEIENTAHASDSESNPETAYASSEAEDLLHESISGLPNRVREVIDLHYFQGLSIAEIADQMRISVGAVKYHLHEGRRRIRKDLCAMNERIGDTLPERVMKKVEELKRWQLRQCKDGFADVYADVLRDVEELPESKDKYHALADVLMRGWWWLPGKKNDELFARIVEAAELGHNDEVMRFIVSREDGKLSGKDKIEFIRDKQIPRLEAAGFRGALAYEWLWLGREYMDAGEGELGQKAFARAMELAKPTELCHAYATALSDGYEEYLGAYKDKKTEKTFVVQRVTAELRLVDGQLCRWDDLWFSRGALHSFDHDADLLFVNASYCDGIFTVPGASVGDVREGSDGVTLMFAEDGVTVGTPAGTFDGCRLWLVRSGHCTYRTYYKDGVGIVKQERICHGITETRALSAYEIKGGEGLIPLAPGNFWEYDAGYDTTVLRHRLRFEVHGADCEYATVIMKLSLERLRYDEDSWLDMIQYVRNEYWREENGQQKIADVSHEVSRAEATAKTKFERAHTRAAVSVARRIMATDPGLNPGCTEIGHWNFFMPAVVHRRGGEAAIDWDTRWSFEWKRGTDDSLWEALLYNDVYQILNDAAKCLWSESWRIGASLEVEYDRWGDMQIKTEIRCLDGGSVTTKAGTFRDCMLLALDTTGFSPGLEYRGGKREYYFAPNIGIVKTVNYYCGGARRAVYELTSYEGEGEGYMPICDGMKRRFDAVGLTDGYIGWAEYEFVDDGDGRIVIFTDRCGVQRKADITQYGSILSEFIEEELWESGKHDESRVRNGINNLNIIAHFIERNGRSWCVPERAIAQSKYKLKLMESFGGDGDIPKAWLGAYATRLFAAGCNSSGCGDNDACFRYLDRAFELFEEWFAIPNGTALEVGDKWIFSGIKVIKGEGLIELPDGTREPLESYIFNGYSAQTPHYALTATSGWEWFDSARGDERYPAYVERAKKLMETGKS